MKYQVCSDWITFNSNSPYETLYRRVGNEMEIRGWWSGDGYDTYEEALHDNGIIAILNYDVGTILPSGINILDQYVIMPERRIELFLGKYINSLRWMTKQSVDGWNHEALKGE